MTAEARRALATIRECIEAERFTLTVHFSLRMQQRGLFWPDIQAVIDNPSELRSQGMDDYNRPKWIIGGEAAYGSEIEIVCTIESLNLDDTEESETEFITLYWED